MINDPDNYNIVYGVSTNPNIKIDNEYTQRRRNKTKIVRTTDLASRGDIAKLRRIKNKSTAVSVKKCKNSTLGWVKRRTVPLETGGRNHRPVDSVKTAMINRATPTAD